VSRLHVDARVGRFHKPRARVERGVVLVVAAALAGPTAGGTWGGVATTGWALVLAAVLMQAVLIASAWRSPPD
jgi:hypothetical protein